mmetsp:Transcript_137535/g.383575  ORF Transcript_137535/g.383575 Transcript_137535/m.383575 type:complete len:517 (+) Transcript_137535:40-1590(+)
MSEVYVKEPNTKGRAVLRTTHGDLEVELWATECPKACRNFCQLILEGYYNDTVFHRVIRDFIIQGGDKTGTGDGCESIYGKPYADEIHPRLKFRYRGMMGIASAGRGTKTNGSQFFITLGRAPSLDGKHTLFGKVVGQTMYNLVRLSEVQVDRNDHPLEPPRIIRAELTWDPFGDLDPRCAPQPPVAEKSAEEPHRRAPVRNRNVLSFAASDGEEDDDCAGKTASGKSAHDLLNDPKLSKEVAYPSQEAVNSSRKRVAAGEEEASSEGVRNAGSVGRASGTARDSAQAEGGGVKRGSAAAKPALGGRDSESSEEEDDEDEDGGAMQLEKASKRQATIAMLKRDIAGLSAGPAPEDDAKKKKKPLTALEEQRAGYVPRGKAMVIKKADKKKNAVQVQDRLKAFSERVRAFAASAEEEAAALEEEGKAKEQKEEGTFSAIWDEGDEESSKDWLAGGGLKFHVSADKAFKLESLKARENLEIFDPLAAKGNEELLAENRKRRAEQMRPTLRRREPPKKW